MTVMSLHGMPNSNAVTIRNVIISSNNGYTYDYETSYPTLYRSETTNYDSVIHLLATGYITL